MNSLRNRLAVGGKQILRISAAVTLSTAAAWGQTLSSSPSKYLAPTSLPSPIPDYVRALGNRLQVPGNECLVMKGILTTAKGTGPVTITWQLPGELRVEWPVVSTVITVDQTGVINSSSPLDENDANLLDILLYDRPEAFFFSLHAAAQMRLVAERATLEGGSDTGMPTVNVLELFQPVVYQTQRLVRQATFLFDSTSLLLRSVSYPSSSGASNSLSITLYGGWSNTPGGFAYPNSITNVQNGSQTMTLTNISATVTPALPETAFAKP